MAQNSHKVFPSLVLVALCTVGFVTVRTQPGQCRNSQLGDLKFQNSSFVDCSALNESALVVARKLSEPVPKAVENGEFEDGEFWEEHETLLQRAWEEFDRVHPELFAFGKPFEERYISAELRGAAKRARSGEGENALWDLFYEHSPGIWASNKIFTSAFFNDMLEDLDHIRNAGIPTRRPNGMNRYGAILDDVGFAAMLKGLVQTYVRPLAEMLFPSTVGRGDAEEHYAFSVRYRKDEDTELVEHADASVATMNLCLGRNWSGGGLRFVGNGFPRFIQQPQQLLENSTSDFMFEAGTAIFHRGQHRHMALPLIDGERTNLIVWLMGKWGVVRVAPYDEGDSARLHQVDRWHY